MNNIFDALEICLQELENGTDMEAVLARFPDLAGELRPILKASEKARSLSAAEPSEDAIRRGRARLMQRAAEMRESRVAPRKRVIPAFQRLALSFSLAALLLMSGTGLLNASASALPGESLYPVKRTWEGLRLLLIFNEEARKVLEDEFEDERLHEVNELLTEGRHESIQFAGIYMQVNGVDYISGVRVILPSSSQIPAHGSPVIISGQTNADGFVEIVSLDQLPEGSIVPMGTPIEVELENESASGNESPEANVRYYEIEGTLQTITTSTLVINGLTVHLDETSVEGELCPGIEVEAIGYTAEDGKFVITEIKAKGACSNDEGNGNANSNTNSNTNGSPEPKENENGNENENENGNENENENGNENENENKNENEKENENDDDDDGNDNDSNDNDND